ncbi:MAG: LLM class flavin-dependent oxidoreductase [Deltaproteobacteria bacterium]|nr:LLM class flavin-dependent oxidoreductase [Deltaproteobacteria bacterium]
MKLGMTLGYAGPLMNTTVQDLVNMEKIGEVERLGYDSIWTAESWGNDAVTPLAWVGSQTSTIKLGTAIMQLAGRSPANAAMTAITMDTLSNGRFIMGLGTSGPQVVEGWHGVPFNKTLTWLREYVTIVKQIFAREAPLEFDGARYQMPYRGEGSSGQGKPLKSMVHGRPGIPVYTGSMAPQSQVMSAELADGCLLTCMHPDRSDVLMENFNQGFEKAGNGKSIETFDIAPTVVVIIGDPESAMIPCKMSLALYIGGMGSKQKNFYKEYLSRVRDEAIAAVPDEMVDALYLVGSKDRIRDRFQRWKESPVGTMMVGSQDMDTLRFMAELNS